MTIDPTEALLDEQLTALRQCLAEVQATFKAGGYAELPPDERALLDRLVNEAADAIDDYFADEG